MPRRTVSPPAGESGAQGPDRACTAARRRWVAFLGGGVGDALALHAADVGVSATDVAKDAADVIPLEKDLGVRADGVTEGPRILADTIKCLVGLLRAS
jgi:Mg2+-importing ATPase